MQKRFRFVGILLFLLILTIGCSNNQNAGQADKDKSPTTKNMEKVELIISAAASLKDAMDVIQSAYEEKHPEVTLKFNFWGSGSLQQQISQGAPADLFFSAAKDKFDLLVDEGMIADEDGVNLLGNELVLVVPKVSETVNSFEELATADIDKLAIGTPETVPAGKYAKASLKQLEIWNEVEPKVVYAKDVRQVLSYVNTGNVDAGIVYKTDALISDDVEIAATADPSTHDPIIYPVGVIKDSKQYDAAKSFYEYLQSDEALRVFEEYGFTIN